MQPQHTARRARAAVGMIAGHVGIALVTIGLWWGVLMMVRLLLGRLTPPWLAAVPP